MLVLPTGQILLTDLTEDVAISTPAPGHRRDWAPAAWLSRRKGKSPPFSTSPQPSKLALPNSRSSRTASPPAPNRSKSTDSEAGEVTKVSSLLDHAAGNATAGVARRVGPEIVSLSVDNE